jgi:hypothetical protein
LLWAPVMETYSILSMVLSAMPRHLLALLQVTKQALCQRSKKHLKY